MDNRYPEYIMRYLRQRRGLPPDDTRDDEWLSKFTPAMAFSEVLEWKGFLGGWDTTIKGWILDIFGVDLDDLEENQ